MNEDMEKWPSQDEHVIEAIGRCRVVVRCGRVVDVAPPLIASCPLARKFTYPVAAIAPDEVGKNIEARVAGFGMCSPDRQLYSEGEFVGFGASEILSFSLGAGLLDCAVIACEGAGSVVVSDPGLIQGIGGRMSGLVSTTPIPGVILGIKRHGGRVLDPVHSAINPVAAVKLAINQGYRRVGVTVADADTCERVRDLLPDALVIAVHMTGISPADAVRIVASADIVTACASKAIRDAVTGKALVQAGSAVPVFAVTKRGKTVILAKVGAQDSPLFIRNMPLPVAWGEGPAPLV
jgi:putative methanogenesis marker protein 8